jgi:uncharacterized membrane protein
MFLFIIITIFYVIEYFYILKKELKSFQKASKIEKKDINID